MSDPGSSERAQRLRTVQLTLPFPGEAYERLGKITDQDIEKWIQWRYPVTPDERLWLPERVRLARLVPLSECKGCPLACEDHTAASRFKQPVCLKDLRAIVGT